MYIHVRTHYYNYVCFILHVYMLSTHVQHVCTCLYIHTCTCMYIMYRHNYQDCPIVINTKCLDSPIKLERERGGSLWVHSFVSHYTLCINTHMYMHIIYVLYVLFLSTMSQWICQTQDFLLPASAAV